MPHAATVLREGAEDAPAERRPGEFARHAKTGAPYVADPERTTKRDGRKADLIAECARAGIAIPEGKVTVAQLQELLGPRPCKVQYGRPSGLGKQIENTTNLQKWAERASVLGSYIGAIELFKELEHLDPSTITINDLDDENRDLLDSIAVRAKNLAQAGIASERGTHGHELTEDHDNEIDWIERSRRGEDLGLSITVQAAVVQAWEKMLQLQGFEILAVEARCVDDIWRQAGTLDRIVRATRDIRFIMPTGEIVVIAAGWVGILDIKTGKLRLDDAGFVSYWHAYSVQLASYAQSVPYDPDTDTRGEWPWPIDQRFAIIAHLDILAALDGQAVCRLVLVDLEAGRHAGALCVAAREWERRRDVFSLPIDELAVSVPVEQCAALPAEGQPGAEGPANSPAPTFAAPDLPQVEQPAAPGDVREVRRRVQRDRYRSWSDETKRLWMARKADIDIDDCDAVDALMDEIDPFATVIPAPEPPPAVAPVRSLAFEGDEGERVSDVDARCARDEIAALGDAYADVHRIGQEATDAGVGFKITALQSRRRWEIYRALGALARHGWDDDTVRDLLAAATDDPTCCQPAIPLGRIVGLLDVAQARVFADMAVALASEPALAGV